MAVFDRVPMNVVEMAFEIVFVSNRVFPKLRLPDAATTVTLATRCNDGFIAATGKPTLRELRLNPLPAVRKSIIAYRHGPYGMQMIGKQHDSENVKRMGLLAVTKDLTEDTSSPFGREYWTPSVCHDREEERPARNVHPSPIRH